MPAAKAYSGRLAFDPDSGFHLGEDGKKVVTDDEGKSWRYANDDDPSHLERYHRRFAEIDSTANQFAELAFKHGEEQAATMVEPHHFEAQPDDAHYDENAEGKSSPKSDPDAVAATVTSHTEAPHD